MNLRKKKILIVGGASQHCKIVEKAKELDIETHVIDFLHDSPAKKMADFSYDYNVIDYKNIINLVKEKKIDGAISGWLDFCQVPYNNICEKCGLISYGSTREFDVLTNKTNFKNYCLINNVKIPGVININDIDIKYPVFVKPSDSRGSRGSSVCFNKEQLLSAIEIAKNESFDGKAILEEYFRDDPIILVVYFFVDGEPYLQQISDAYFGDKKYGQEKINNIYKSPSKYANLYLQKADLSMKKMLKSLGIKFGPVCFQAFVHNNDVYFYDPGRRFPGGEYERAMLKATGCDYVKAMIEYSVNGSFNDKEKLSRDTFLLNGKHVARLQLNLIPGVIAKIEGFDSLSDIKEIEYIAFYHNVGDEILLTKDVRMRFAQIVFVADSETRLKDCLNLVYDHISVKDITGNEMLVPKFNTELFN